MSQIPKAIAIFMVSMVLIVAMGAHLESKDLAIPGFWGITALITIAGVFCIGFLYHFEDSNPSYIKVPEPSLSEEDVQQLITKELKKMIAQHEGAAQTYSASSGSKVGDLTK